VRHKLDRDVPAAQLQTYSDPFAARDIATFTDDGRYRPLKSAPNLRRGWRMAELDFDRLVTAIDCFYPAALAHWHAWREAKLQTTTYRSCAARQSGMYRITTLLGDEQVRRVAACCCNDGECVKIPFWQIDETTKLGLEMKTSTNHDHVSMPCPEPCSLFLSFARKAVRLEQEETMSVQFTKFDLELIARVLRSVLDGTAGEFREGDYNDPRHRQRILYFLKKYEHLLPESPTTEHEGDE
jgi:hypothetical protein